ncbi:MAG TPA: hypothetical protein VHL59_17775, partial [Thermoanaerobaculia bacterium]|nr:hypothetical protein [Thermoanaerobaculia bacterium]
EFTGNTISGNFQRGFHGQSQLGTGLLNLRFANNILTGTANAAAGALQGVFIETGGSADGHNNALCLDMAGNSVTMVDTTAYRLRNEGAPSGCPSCSFALEGFSGNGASATDVSNWITGAPRSNTHSTSSATPINIQIDNAFTTSAGCTAPTL